MKNQKAMSEIVTTVIMVVLALIAVGVIWGIINNLLGGKGAEIDISQKCLAVDIVPTKVTCGSFITNETFCNVTLERRAGGEEIKGIKVVFKSSGGKVTDVIGSPNNIEELATVIRGFKVNTTLTGFNLSSEASKVEVTPYFEDEAGNSKNCPRTTEYNF
jgi:flagellin-like protein